MRCTRPGERQEPSKRGRHRISGMMSIKALPLFQKIERGKNLPGLLWPPPAASAMLFSSVLVLLDRRKEDQHDALFKEGKPSLLASPSHALVDHQYHSPPSR